MPSESMAQHNLMAAASHGAPWAAAKVKPSVAKDFVSADQASGRLYEGGPAVKHPKVRSAINKMTFKGGRK